MCKTVRPRFAGSLLVTGLSLIVASLQAQEPTGVVTVSQELTEAVAQRCLAEAASGDAPMGDVAFMGQVVDTDTGQPVSDAIVWVRPAGGVFEAIRGSPNGTILLCGFPGGVRLEVQASSAAKLSEIMRVELPEQGLALRTLEVSEEVLATARVESTPSGESARLQGVVRSAETDEPLPGARVMLPGLGIESISDANGVFSIPEVPLGRHQVVAEYLGMTSGTVTVDMTGDLYNVALFTLQTTPVTVQELHVEVERTYWHPRIQGFHDRMERGLGNYITQEDVAFTDVIWAFRRLPGVRVDQCVTGSGLRDTGCYTLRITRGYGIGRGCSEPVAFLDGHQISGQGIPGGDILGRLNAVRHRLEGIEVYRNPAGAPGRFRRLGDACGIILAWTRAR
jgi:hypothetical protein